MKKILSLLFVMAYAVFAYAQDEPPPQLYPLVDGKVMYEKVVDAPGTNSGSTDIKILQWVSENLKDTKLVSHSPEIGQLVYLVKIFVDNQTVDFTLQTDAKDGKYRYRVFDIKSTVTGKENTAFFAKYLVNVPAENDNAIVKGEVKGFSKGQKKDIQKKIIAIDKRINQLMSSMQSYLEPKKAAEF